MLKSLSDFTVERMSSHQPKPPMKAKEKKEKQKIKKNSVNSRGADIDTH